MGEVVEVLAGDATLFGKIAIEATAGDYLDTAMDAVTLGTRLAKKFLPTSDQEHKIMVSNPVLWSAGIADQLHAALETRIKANGGTYITVADIVAAVEEVADGLAKKGLAEKDTVQP